MIVGGLFLIRKGPFSWFCKGIIVVVESLQVIAIPAIFLLAGFVKGIIGLGLPTISLGLLAVTFDLTTAMALPIVPSFVTNIWQAAVGGNAKVILKRMWPFLGMATISIWLGAAALSLVNTELLFVLLGVLFVFYSSTDIVGFRLSLSPQGEKIASPLLGAVNGILTGMTGSFVVPGVLFFQAIGLPRNILIQSMGMLFSFSTAGLALALQKYRILTPDLALVSAFSVFPALVGMIIGQKVRQSFSEKTFRRIFFISLFILGIFMIGRSSVNLMY